MMKRESLKKNTKKSLKCVNINALISTKGSLFQLTKTKIE